MWFPGRSAGRRLWNEWTSIGYLRRDAALVSGALETLKFEPLPGKPDLIGAPPKMQVTKKTIEHLQKLMKEGRSIQVDNDGAIKVLEKSK